MSKTFQINQTKFQKNNRKNVIDIYNPNDKPYGPLSNNYIDSLRIDDTIWPTVTNYILANMLITPMYKTIIQNARIISRKKNTNIDDKVRQLIINIETRQGRKIDKNERAVVYQNVLNEVQIAKMDIYQLYNMYLNVEYINTIRSAVEKAYNVRFTQDQYVQKLLATGNALIEYVSNNTNLGIGPKGNGANIIGKILMQIRFNLSRQKRNQNIEEKEQYLKDKIFTIYVANKILRKKLEQGSDIKQFIDKNPTEIVDIYSNGNNINLVYRDLNISPDIKDTILTMYHRGQLPYFEEELQNPGILAALIRKAEIRNIAERLKNKRKNIIFKTYVKYYAKKEKPNLTDEELDTVFNQLPSQAPSITKYYEVRDRIYKLFKLGQLSETLSDQIDDKLKIIPNIPSEEEIAEVENTVLSRPPSQAEVIEETHQSSSSSSDKEDPLKILFSTDEKQKKNNLIKLIQKYTGKKHNKYKNKSIEQLESILRKYQDYKLIAKKVQLTVNKDKLNKLTTKLEQFKRDGYTEAYTKSGSILSFKDIAKNYANAFNNIGDGSKIMRVWQLSKSQSRIGGRYDTEEKDDNTVLRTSAWAPDPIMEPPVLSSEEIEGKKETGVYVKPRGESIYIKDKSEQNDPNYEIFSPMYQENIEIDGITYPSIAMYIMVRLLENTGVRRNYMKKSVVSKGMGIGSAIDKLQNNGKWVSIKNAIYIYDTINENTYRELLETFMRIALDKKFQNREIQGLLLTTKNAKLLWTDPNDLFLGSGTGKNIGRNKVGKYLMELREKIKKSWVPIKLDSKNLFTFIQKDNFMFSWVHMRLRDMCGIVYMINKYLLSNNVEEDMNAQLTKTILDTIYYPCGKLFKNVTKNSDLKPPPEFTRMIIGCPGMQFKPSEDFDTQIRELKLQKKSIEENPRDVATIKRTTEEIIAFEEKQARDWDMFIDDMNKPELSQDEISNKIAKFDKKQKLDRQKRTKKGKTINRKFLSNQEKEKESYVENLMLPKISSAKDRAKQIEQFKYEQQRESDNFYGIKRGKETKEEIMERKQNSKILRNKITRLNYRRSNQYTHYQIELAEISRIYWEKIAIMLQYLTEYITKIRKSEYRVRELDLKLVLAQLEMINSKDNNCIKILDDKNDNCIASALINLLIGIEKFKNQYADNIKLGEDEINLAASIILNKDISDTKIGDVIELNEELDNESDNKSDDELVEDKLVYEYDSKQDGDMAEFSFNDSIKNDVEIIKGQLTDISTVAGYDNIDDVAKFFVGMIKIIKSFPMSHKVKRNRINFFATLR